jgi:TolB-like protein/Tfp pilus assembly protein PilF
MPGLGKMSSPDPHPTSAADRLDSWKEIAAYLKRSVRTVRRWEAEQGLPVHRHQHQTSGTVYAFKPEMDAWWASRAADFAATDPTDSVRKAQASKRGWLAVAGVLAVIAVVLYAYDVAHRTGRNGTRVMLAVLPLENLSPDSLQDYISDGMTEDFITELGHLNPERLGVIARTSVARYRRTQKSIDEIGRELHVDYVLEGSIRRQGEQVRVTAQLIRVKDQTHVWAESYDRNSSDLLGVQADIAQALSRAAEIELMPAGSERLARRVASNETAHDAYLMGRYLWNKRSADALRQSFIYFEKAIEADPNYARAYLGLSDYYVLLPAYSDVPANEAASKAESAASKALELDPTLGEAYATLAAIASSRWHWQEADAKFKQAISLASNYATSHQWYAEYLQSIGNLEKAGIEIRKAQELDPLSIAIAAGLAQQFYFSRQYDAALAQYGKVMEMDPSLPGLHLHIGLVQVGLGRVAAAAEQFLKASAVDPNDPGPIALLAYLDATSGKVAEARATLRQLEGRRGRQQAPAADLAIVHMGLGEMERTFTLFNRACDEHEFVMIWIKSSPFFDPLRSDPRYAELLKRMNLRAN